MTLRLLAALALPLAWFSGQQTVFRTRTDVVAIDATVMDGKKPVTTLGIDGFVVKDNGVVQTLIDVGREQMPLDITLTIDLSGSVNESERLIIHRAIRQIGAALRPADRGGVVSFTSHIAQEVKMQPPPFDPPLNFQTGGWTTPFLDALLRPQHTRSHLMVDRSGMSSFLDALLLSLVTPPMADRRQLNLILTDGVDTSSFFELATIADTMKYATGQTSIVILRGGGGHVNDEATLKLLKNITETSGGQMMELGRGESLSEKFLAALDQFRTSYVLRYTPTGVPRAGWHAVDVSTKNSKYKVRARQGYWFRAER